jgi:carnosine N-methyltransferase
MSSSSSSTSTTTAPDDTASFSFSSDGTASASASASISASSLAYQTYLRQDKAEQAHFQTVCKSYRQYATFAFCHWENQVRRLLQLTDRQRQVLPPALVQGTLEFQQRQQQFQQAAVANQFCLDCVLMHAGVPHSQDVKKETKIVDDAQVSKASSVLKSLARDWSTDGLVERELAYRPILDAVKRDVLLRNKSASALSRICVPAAGFGRLALELASLGYTVQGNEFSLHMLLASDFILNNGNVCTTARQLEISPWLLESRNVHASGDPCRKVMIPDVDPSSMLDCYADGGEGFSMAAGDFCSIYSNPNQKNQWNAVVSCFFLDAAPNMIEYIQIIHDMLAEGGVLVNFGPLLHHWSGPAMRPDDATYSDYQKRFSYMDQRYMESVDLCWQDIREILVNVGFVMLEERVGMPALYTADRRSMMNMSYRVRTFDC